MRWALLSLLCVLLPSALAFEVLICKDPGCSLQDKVFEAGERIFLNYTHPDRDTLTGVQGKLTYPKEKLDHIKLPSSVRLTGSGPYMLEATAFDRDKVYRSVKTFVLIQPEPEPVQETAEEKQDVPESTAQNEPDDYDIMASNFGYKRQYPGLLGSIIALSVLLGIVIVLYLIVKIKNRPASLVKLDLDQLAEIHSIEEPHQYMNKLVDYIRQAFAAGYSKEEIRAHLQEKGWKKKQVEEGFRRHKLLGTYHDMKEKNIDEKKIRDMLLKEFKPAQVKQTLMHHTVKLGREPTAEDKRKHLAELASLHLQEEKTQAEDIAKYIKECYMAGYSKQMIRELLIEQGYLDKKIENAFDKI
mgnify:CR=1 FL=1